MVRSLKSNVLVSNGKRKTKKMIDEIVFRNLIKLYWFARGKKIGQIFKELEANQRLTSENIRDLEIKKLKKLVEHCYRTVPYYKNNFDKIGVKPDDIRNFDDYKKIPFLSKSDVRKNYDSLISESFQKKNIFRSSTGGSTGEPLNFCHSLYYRQISDAIIMRYWGWAGWRLADKVAWLWGAPQETAALSMLKGNFLWWLNRRKLLNAFDINEKKMEGLISDIRDFKPKYLNGYATTLETFANFLIAKGVEIDGIKGIFSTAERLFPKQRAIIEKAFGCKVYDQYGSREIFGIAAECPHGKMHINSDIVHVEFEVERGSDIGRLILTALDNYAMPLLRYEIGDFGVPSNETCACGLPFPVMKLKIGRVTDNFVTPDNRVVHGEYFTHLMYGIDGIERFQFKQVRRDRIELYLVKNGSYANYTNDRVMGVASEIKKEFCIDTDLRYVDSIPLTATGKHRFTVSEVAREIQ